MNGQNCGVTDYMLDEPDELSYNQRRALKEARDERKIDDYIYKRIPA